MKKNPSPRLLGAAAVTAALLVPLAVFGAPALAHGPSSSASQYQYASASQYQYKIDVCHRTHSKKHPWVQLHVSFHAWKGHSHHDGDFIGLCTQTHGTTTTGHSGTEHGKSAESHGHHHS